MRRPVRCRWCSQSGHNLRGCEEHKKWILENPESSYARRDSQIRARAKNKKCSYCYESGHNKKTCSTRIVHFSELQKLNKAYRRFWYDNMSQLGIGVGSLISRNQPLNTYDAEKKEYVMVEQPLMFVEEILWDNVCITEWTSNYQIKARYTNVIDHYSNQNKTEYLSVKEMLDDRAGKNVVSPIEPSNEDLNNWFEKVSDHVKNHIDNNKSSSVEKFIQYMKGELDPMSYWTKPPDLKKYLDG